MTALMWFREDLRIGDNPALYYASHHSKDGLAAVYIFDHQALKEHHMAACRVEFILRGLQALKSDLASLNIPLIILQVEKTAIIPETLWQLGRQLLAEALFFNLQYELDEKKRDQAVQTFMQTKKIACYSYDDQTILPPKTIKTQSNSYYKVFTPYKRAWLKVFADSSIKILPRPKKQTILNIQSSSVPLSIDGIKSKIDPNLWPAGEEIAAKKLQDFINDHLADYHQLRDFPALPATSQLSPYLSAGMISPRQCFMAAWSMRGKAHFSKGAESWMSELIWREFYKNLLIIFPRLSMNKAFLSKTENFPWNNDPHLFTAWKNGQTGFPIIDAAMRQLNTTGWMHNRLRMIVASFLVKNLLIDWRLGEKYFMQHLIDGDLAANNGGWQWAASTGVDSVPYFRVFNPLRQSQRFDPENLFIHKFCPELKSTTTKIKYPKPIVDLEKTRKRYIELYKKLA